ncbi:hypothetical protein Tamer19_12100 [Cupriavidus sp. TA19]|uniref:tripartite tricarboxylate transporter substrate binding protein n=1 Tax=Cupriavidus sp. TA19 TaxID=701108 RepID=UPI00272947D4|nr:tripartite tricarboxylate transporter substrate binding protein [Cupriavidus sp. TA19]GLC91802.1 hypothetical protein Tamer19_12100 [Cupriavidus sp. TA19]
MNIFLRAIAAAVVALVPMASALAQENYPSHPIKIVVPFPPGGTSDTVARLVAAKLKDKLGQPVLVDNKGGGGTIIGTEAVARSPADGYTLLWATPPFAINHSLYTKRPYDAFKDFVAVVDVASMPLVLIVPPNSPAKNLQELIALAKKNPGKLSYGSSGNGGSPHLAMETFKSASNADIKHIPYRGSAPAFTDLLGGQTDVMIDTTLLVTPYVAAGKVRALAQTGTERSSALPNVPTMREAGVPGVSVSAWLMLVAPAGTPDSIVRKLNTAVNEVLKTPSVRDQLEKQGLEITAGSQADAARHLKADIDMYAKAIKASGVKAE